MDGERGKTNKRSVLWSTNFATIFCASEMHRESSSPKFSSPPLRLYTLLVKLCFWIYEAITLHFFFFFHTTKRAQEGGLKSLSLHKKMQASPPKKGRSEEKFCSAAADFSIPKSIFRPIRARNVMFYARERERGRPGYRAKERTTTTTTRTASRLDAKKGEKSRGINPSLSHISHGGTDPRGG